MTENIFDMTDDQVIRSVREGYPRRYEIIVNRYKHKITNFIHKMIFDHDEAQSLAQDVFLKVYSTIDKYKTQDNFQAFLFTIARNMTLNYIKKQKRTVFFSGFLSGSPESESKHLSVEDEQHASMERTQQQELMMDALKEIKENQRLALVLKVYMDFSYKKIAEITGWSIPKIETLISRAKSNLREKIRLREDGGNRRPQTGQSLKKNLQENIDQNVLEVRTI